jgi:hypothetical protein
MAKIRSVHPGLFTDEAFVTVSAEAEIFYIGLWTEADDQGVFEWKPVTLKMRLRAASSADTVELLKELSDKDMVRRFEVRGRVFGAIRNFKKFQKPERPRFVHPLPDELRDYVGFQVLEQTGNSDEAPPEQPNDTDTTPTEQCSDTSGRGRGTGKGKNNNDGGFSGSVIRLTRAKLEHWMALYPHIPNLRSMLASRDLWLQTPGAEKARDNWFMSTNNYLAIKEQEFAAKALAAAKPRVIDRNTIAG